MPEKGIEYDLRGTAVRRDSRILDPEDLGRQNDASTVGGGWGLGADRADRPGDHVGALSEARLLGPVPAHQELLDRVLAKMIELANGQEKSCREPCRVDLREGEGRLSQPAELRAKLLHIEGTRGCRRERCLPVHRDALAARDEDELERAARLSEGPNIETRLARA